MCLFFLFFNFDDFTTLIVAASRANAVRQTHLAAVAAGHQSGGGQCVMGAPAIAATLRVFAFRMRGHG
jgi:hypothetical protein